VRGRPAGLYRHLGPIPVFIQILRPRSAGECGTAVCRGLVIKRDGQPGRRRWLCSFQRPGRTRQPGRCGVQSAISARFASFLTSAPRTGASARVRLCENKLLLEHSPRYLKTTAGAFAGVFIDGAARGISARRGVALAPGRCIHFLACRTAVPTPGSSPSTMRFWLSHHKLMWEDS
jgi:hypothetical protein